MGHNDGEATEMVTMYYNIQKWESSDGKLINRPK